jgi:hypothetical protein
MAPTASHRFVIALTLATIVIVAGCSQSSPNPASPSSPASAGGLNGNAPPAGWVDVFPRQANTEAVEVCKVYVGTVGPAVTFTVAADIGNNGSIDQTYTVTLSNNQCRDVWLSENPGDSVTVTEAVPTGYTASFVKHQLSNGSTTIGPSTPGNSASGFANGTSGALLIFTNTEDTTTPGTGRFTGGGSQIRIDGVRITRGLTVHCDLLLSNNLEVNWQGNQFHMEEHLTTVACTDDPAIIQAPPAAPLDTLIGTGTGRYNGTSGYTIEFTMQDYGEPGENDKMRIKIFQASNPSNIVLDIPLQTLTGGNLQAHFDQPHK